MIEFSFPAPTERLTKNQRLHWAHRSKLVAEWRQAAFLAGRQYRLTSRIAQHAVPPSVLTVTFEVPDMRRRDADGPAPTVSAIQDGLVDAGFWPDDTPEYVAATGSVFVPAKDRTHLMVTVRLTRMGES